MSEGIDIHGRRFGRLVVLRRGHPLGTQEQYTWVCRCDCGKSITVLSASLRRGTTKSCGCYKRDRVIQRNTVHGKTGTRTYRIWQHMLRRCYKKEDASYGRYGGRGIRVAGRWRRCFANFFADMGACPIGLSLNRKNNEEGYSKDNCNWATPKEQARNTRNNVVMEGFGKVKCISEWAEDPRCVVGLSLLRYRLDRQGWPLAQAMMMPPRKSWSRRRGDRSYKEAG